MQYKFITKSEKETKSFAKKLASKLKQGDIIILTGELGSGKTKFTEGILSYFNLENEISSPTFTIVNEYNASPCPIFHFDVGDEYFEKGISIIEWGEIIKDILPKEYIKISFEKDNKNENIRILNIEIYGNKFDNYFKED